MEVAMREVVMRLGMVCALLLGGAAAGRAAVALPCAEYISSGGNDDPMFGQLIGTETRSVVVSVGTKAEPGGIGGSINGSYTVTWDVGYYQLTDGRRIAVDCRNYTWA
jgi:hypothetical protein